MELPNPKIITVLFIICALPLTSYAGTIGKLSPSPNFKGLYFGERAHAI